MNEEGNAVEDAIIIHNFDYDGFVTEQQIDLLIAFFKKMIITINDDIRTLKVGERFELLTDFPSICVLVGKNGSGKSTLLQAIRGRFDTKNQSLYQRDFIKVSKSMDIECEYDKYFFLDAHKDNASDINNAYDAVAYIKSGGFDVKDISHGQSQIYHITKLIASIKKWRESNPTAMGLVVLDEFDKGFDLFNQSKCYNIIMNIVAVYRCNVICATHNTFLIRSAMYVYDMDSRSEVNSEEYLKQFNA